MMTIRSRLLCLLLPTLLGFICLVSFWLYFNWSNEIITSFEMRLKSIATSSSAFFTQDEGATFEKEQKLLSVIQERVKNTRLYLLTLQKGSSGASMISQLTPEDEEKLLVNKKTVVTHFSDSKNPQGRILTAFAPVVNGNQEVVAIVAAEISSDALKAPIDEAFSIILLSACTTAILLAGTIFFIANKISKPVSQLKNSALAIAAGNYGESIHVKGPKEIVELAHTLNTMSQCLAEQISHLQENALMRERLYGEYECSLLLQQQMVQKVLENYKGETLSFKSLSLYSAKILGVLLQLHSSEDKTELLLSEATQDGFKGIFELITSANKSNTEHFPNQLRLHFEHTDQTITFSQHHFPPPLFWSTKQQTYLEPSANSCSVQQGDYLFLFNKGFAKLIGDQMAIEAWFGRILRHFAAEGLEICSEMLDKALHFASRKYHLEEDIHLLCIRVAGSAT